MKDMSKLPARYVFEACTVAGASPDVAADLKRAYDFIGRSGVDGTPALVVNGKYRVIGGQTYAERLQIVDRLVAQERAARRTVGSAKR